MSSWLGYNASAGAHVSPAHGAALPPASLRAREVDAAPIQPAAAAPSEHDMLRQ